VKKIAKKQKRQSTTDRQTYLKYANPECKVIVSGKSTAMSTTDDSTTDVAFAFIRYRQSALFTGWKTATTLIH